MWGLSYVPNSFVESTALVHDKGTEHTLDLKDNVTLLNCGKLGVCIDLLVYTLYKEVIFIIVSQKFMYSP